MTQYQPTQNYVLLIPEKIAEQTKAGIYLPEQAQNNASEGQVVKVGPAVVDVQVGDTVVFTEHTEYKLREDGDNLIVVAESNIILRKPNSFADLEKRKREHDKAIATLGIHNLAER